MIFNKIKQARIKTGLSRKEVAKKIGIPYTTYTNYETGYRVPRIDTVQKIARALNVSIDELLGDTMYIDTVENISALLNSGEATAANLPEKVKEKMPNLPEDELIRVMRYTERLKQYEAEERHARAFETLLKLPENQREAVYTIIEGLDNKEDD